MKLAQCRPITCATSTSMTPSSREERGQPTRAQQVADIERRLLGMYADPALDRKPDLLGERGGAFYSEAAVALLASLVADAGDTQVVNVRNARHAGVPAGRRGDRGPGGDRLRRCRLRSGVSPLSPLMRGLVAHVSAYEELAVDAARRGGRERVVAALLAHPLVGQFEPGRTAGRPADRGEQGLPAVGRGPVTGPRVSPCRRAGHRRREQQDRRRAGGRRRHPAARPPRGPGSNTHSHRARPGHGGARRSGRRRGRTGGPASRPAPATVRAPLPPVARWPARVRLPGRRRPARRRETAGHRAAAAGLGGDLLGRQRHLRDPPGRAGIGTRRAGRRGSALGGRRRPAAPGSTASRVAPDGREARFPALGTVSGDWGGGEGLGQAALW